MIDWCELKGIQPIQDINPSMDLRDKSVRRELFMRFYQFHTQYRIHAGLVYLYLPELAKIEGWDIEQRLWAAFVNGCCENPCTTYFVLCHFPRLPRTENEIRQFSDWHSKEWRLLQYDTDTRYNKGHLVEQMVSYVKSLKGGTQIDFFIDEFSQDQKVWFDNIYSKAVRLYKFGRLTTWSYLEFVKILSGMDFEYSSLKLSDDASLSHRNGLLYVLGQEELEYYPAAGKKGRHSNELIKILDYEGARLLHELKVRFKDEDWSGMIGYETLETGLCTFKNCFRGRRYPNVYTDMSYERIKKAEQVYEKVDFSVFWDIRRRLLPRKLLSEFNPDDKPLSDFKLGYFKNTGHMPMMSVMDKNFKCPYDMLLND